MDGLLTPVSTSYKINSKEKEVEDALVEVPKPEVHIAKLSLQASSPEGALEILKNEPDHDALIATLRYLVNNSHFGITSPSPLAAQLVHVLVSDTVPNYWNVLQGSQKGNNSKVGKSRKSSDLTLLLSCLQSVTGLNAVLLSVKQHIQLSKEPKKTVGGPNIQDILTIYLQLLQTLLGGDDTVRKVWQSVWSTSDPLPKQRALWNEFLNLVGGGKILGLAAEAEDVIRTLSKKADGERYWIAEGSQYSKWLSGDLVHWIRSLQADAENEWKSCSELFNKSLRLGHKGKYRSVILIETF
jgi:telomere length regulation protein